MKPQIILIGGGGHCVSCIDVIEERDQYVIAGIIDLPERKGAIINTHEVIGSDADLPRLADKVPYFFVTIGQIKDSTKRVTLFNKLKELGVEVPTIVSHKAYVSKNADIGEGTIVMHGAIINTLARVGKNCIINTSSLIEHNAVIEDHCHISTGAIVNGGAKVRKNTFLGSNSVTRENIEIGCNSIIGCGVRVSQSLPENSIVREN